METNSKGLRPCPFCGEAEKIAVNEEEGMFPAYVECLTCGCYGGDGDYEDQAKKKWNTRVLDA